MDIDERILSTGKPAYLTSVRNKPENSTCPAGNLKTNVTCPPQF